MVDADGVNMAAIQGLYQMLQEKDARIVSREEEMTTMKLGIPTLPAWLMALIAGVTALAQSNGYALDWSTVDGSDGKP